ncbi:MAG TPA: carboxypeptidase-like regulatory domain-containing protein, partial [Thermoanaerobaculia bacterium]|nr:carboxypeptidase-like regulatory domain-containing protein [Thermoanaerobaculia bacterium]
MKHAKHICFLFAFALLMVWMPVGLFAQSSNGAISGNVSDDQGGALPGVTMTASNVATGATRSTVTNEKGHYEIGLLPPGTY